MLLRADILQKTVVGSPCAIRLRVIESIIARDQIAFYQFYAFHLFLVEVQKTAGYKNVPSMRNRNLEIRIAGDKRSPQ